MSCEYSKLCSNYEPLKCDSQEFRDNCREKEKHYNPQRVEIPVGFDLRVNHAPVSKTNLVERLRLEGGL